jgi:hypothetical protein
MFDHSKRIGISLDQTPKVTEKGRKCQKVVEKWPKVVENGRKMVERGGKMADHLVQSLPLPHWYCGHLQKPCGFDFDSKKGPKRSKMIENHSKLGRKWAKVVGKGRTCGKKTVPHPHSYVGHLQ